MLLGLTVSWLAMTAPPSPDVFLPAEVDGWTPKQPDGLYTADTLFKYIDGGAEVYRSFNVRGVTARRYARAGSPDLLADLFDMGSGEDAYGVYHHDYREGPSAGLGEESEYLEGSLAFWRGRYFVSVMAMEETPESKAAVIKIGRAIDAAIPREGQKPAIVDLLPRENLMVRHVYYFHDHFCLNAHYFVAQDNLLDLGKDTEGVLARYQLPDAAPKDFYLLGILCYPDAARAKAARDKFMAGYLPEAGLEPYVRIENGKWVGVKATGRHVVVVFDAPTREVAETAVTTAASAVQKERTAS